jgi:predicted RNA binding protein YcfA (HicA-like mRNA interferase family)
LPKLRILSGQEICKILSQHGIVNVRQKGSHIIMQKKIDNSTITVPVPNHKEIRIGTLKSIIKQSKLFDKDFE